MSNSVTNLTDSLIDNDKHYYDGVSGFDYKNSYANCTTYAYCTAMYLLNVDTKFKLFNRSNWYGNATVWYSEYKFSKGSTPKIGAICCWTTSDGGSSMGHVAICTAIHSDGTIDFAQGAYGGSRFYKTYNYNYNRSNFAGFCYLCYEDGTAYEPPGNFDAIVTNFYQLDYVQGTGTQYIDTGWYQNYSSGFKVTATYKYSGTSNRCCLLSSYSAASSEGLHKTSFEIANGKSREWLDNGNVDNKSSTLSENSTHTSIFYYGSDGEYKHTVDGGVVANGSYSCSGTNAYSAFLFLDRALRSSIFSDTLQLVSLQIVENGSNVRNFVAAKRISDGLLGMYDAANNVFYYNIGTDSFSGGSIQYGTVSASVSGYGTVSGTGSIPKNPDGCYRATLVATPTSGNTFIGWYNSSGELLSTNTSYSVIESSNVTYIAKFSGEEPTTSPVYVKRMDTWHPADAFYIKNEGSWVQAEDMYVKVDSTWRKQ